MELFDFTLKENSEPEDKTRLTYVQMYFSSEEKERFNKLCKAGMVEYYGHKAPDSNVSDFLLDLLERSFGAQRTINFDQ